MHISGYQKYGYHAETPMMGGGMTPAHGSNFEQGGMTPAHGMRDMSQTPARDDIGGRTPGRDEFGMTPGRDVWAAMTPGHSGGYGGMTPARETPGRDGMTPGRGGEEDDDEEEEFSAQLQASADPVASDAKSQDKDFPMRLLVKLDGQIYKIVSPLDNGEYQIQSLDSQEVQTVSADQLVVVHPR